MRRVILLQIHSQSGWVTEVALHGDQVITSLQLGLVASIYLDILYERQEAVLYQIRFKIELLQESLSWVRGWAQENLQQLEVVEFVISLDLDESWSNLAALSQEGHQEFPEAFIYVLFHLEVLFSNCLIIINSLRRQIIG